MASPVKKNKLSMEEEDEIMKEMCAVNGLNFGKLEQEGEGIKLLEMFFSGFPKLIGMHYFPNLEKLILMGQQINKIEGLSFCPKLQEFWASECCIREITGLESCKLLKKLYLYSNQIRKIKGLEGLTELEVLWLNGNEIQRVENISHIRRLKELNLADNQIEKIGHSLDGHICLQTLNLSGNKLYSFKDLTNLIRLPFLNHLSLKDPLYSPNPVCLLCNYSTHVLYHLPNLTRLDCLDVSNKSLGELAETTVVKKKMFYNMRVKTIKRQLSDMLAKLEEANNHLLKSPRDRLRRLHCAVKEIKREIQELTSADESTVETHDSDTESDRDVRVLQAKEDQEALIALKTKMDAINEKMKQWEKKINEVEFFHKESENRLKQMTELTIHRLLCELETGGNLRFEDGALSDVWFTSCHDLILSRFCASDYKEQGITGIKIHRITRVHNRILRMRFDDKLAKHSEEEDIYNPQKNTQQRKLLEYLFWVWDPEVPGGQTEPARVLEEGFLDADTHLQLGKDGAIPLANSLNMADKFRIEYKLKQSKGKQYSDNTPFRLGQLIISKVYIGRSQPSLDMKQVNKAFYPHTDSVFRPKKHDNCKVRAQSRTSMSNPDLVPPPPAPPQQCECINRQCEWFVFDRDLVMPEYVVEFEYMTRLKPRNTFFQMTTTISSVNNCKGLVGIDDGSDDGDVLDMEPKIKPRPRLIQLTEDLLLKLTKASSLVKVTVLNLHGNGLNRLKHLNSMPVLKKLIISFNEFVRLDDIAGLPLEYLDASFNKINTLEGVKSMTRLKYLDLSWNQLQNTRDDISILRKHAPGLLTVDLRHNNWQKLSCLNGWREPEGLRLRAIGRLKSVTKLNGATVTEAEATAALRMAAGSRISQVSLLAHSRTDMTRPRTLRLGSYAQALIQTSRLKPDRVGEQDNQWYAKVTTLNLDSQHISKLSNLEKLENLRWASFNDNDITKIEGLDACINLEELSLENNCITKLDNISRLTKLRRLNLSHNYLSTLETSGLEKLTHLHFLSLENNRIVSLLGLQRIQSLLELYIGNNRISNIREVFYLKNLPNFVILDLAGNPVAKETENYRLFIIYHLRSLKALDGQAVESAEASTARETFGGRLTADFVAERIGHSNFDEVRELDLPNCSIRTVDLSTADQFINLRSVNLEHNNLASFSGLINLVNLRVLCLNYNHVECILPKSKASKPRGMGNGQSHTVASDLYNPESYTPVLENLEVLHLGYNGIKDMSLLQLNRLTALKALFLQGNEITKIEGLDSLQDLRELVLDRNKIKAISELSFLNQWNLQELHLEENRIKELSNLQPLENLQRFYLGMNRIQDINELEKLEALPNLIELSVVSNAVARRLLHRPMLVYRMPTLLVIDGIPVSDEERTKAELYFMEQQIPQITTTIETTLPGIGQYKTHIPVKVTNVQLNSPERGWANYYKDEEMQQQQQQQVENKGDEVDQCQASVDEVRSELADLFRGRRQKHNGKTDGQVVGNNTRSGTILYQHSQNMPQSQYHSSHQVQYPGSTYFGNERPRGGRK
ncbi:leucine-rich repeat-containing protein 9-like isoform X3 [Lineus longissimus]|uniref:leucine-rich repeat-containing protein 9-like isoform X3 n=1 Tax=Lineus longissimus TaxID=88925 RepID=UPI00315CE4FB